MPAKGTGVIYLMRDKFQIYTTLTPNIFEFRFVPEIVRDLDVINSDLLENIVKIFLQTNKIPPCNFIIVPSDNVCFISDFASKIKPAEKPAEQPAGQNQQQNQAKDKAEADEIKKDFDEQEENFLEKVPFENVASKRITTPQGIRVYAANQELFDELKKVFEEQGSSIDSVIPGGLLGNNLGALPVLTSAAAGQIMQSAPTLKQYNMLVQPVHEPDQKEIAAQESRGEESAEDEPKPQPKTDKKRMVVLASIFGFLIIILIVVYIASNQSSSPTANAQPVSTVQTVPAQ